MTRAEDAAGSPRFDVAALRDIAGDAAFARGSAYARDGRVRLSSVDASGARAEVMGTRVYQAALSANGQALSGACACPAFSDWGFCKHLVAVALTVNAMLPEELATVAGHRERLAEHLRGLGVEALVARLLAWADRDRALSHELELEVSMARDDDDTVFDRVATAMDEATMVDDFIDYGAAGTFADGLRAVLDQIRRVLEAGRAGLALSLLDRFFEDAEALVEAVDDSNGEVGGAIAEAMQLHLEAVLAAKPDPVQLAEQLFGRELESGYGLWDGACFTYADALGPAGAAAYRELAEAAWAERPNGVDRGRLRDVLDAFAMADGDIDARIKLRAADAVTGRDHLAIAELYLDAGRELEARKWVEDGLWKAEDRDERGLRVDAAGIYLRLKEPAKAQALLWTEFEHAPSLRLYLRLLEAGAEAGAAIERAIAVLRRKIDAAERPHFASPSSVMVEILVHSRRMDEAWAVAEAHGCGQAVLMVLVRATEDTHPEKALQVYAKLNDEALKYANQANYPQVVATLARMERISATMGRLNEHAAYVQALTLKHKAKRTFIRLLNDKWSSR